MSWARPLENQAKTIDPVQMEKAETMVMMVSLAAQVHLAGLVCQVHLDDAVHQEQPVCKDNLVSVIFSSN